MSEPSDAELMSRTRDGDREAFTQLVDRHKDPLVNYLTRLAGCRTRAEDLAQESFLRLFQRAGDYDERGRLQAFLYRIATNLLRSEERRARRWRLLQPFLAGDLNGNGHRAAWSPAAETVLARELRERVAAAVVTLPLQFRVPLVLFEIEGWSYADIARQVGCREGTIKSRIHRGKRRLRAQLAPYWNHGGTP
jgi:RNA polymerase sigma-70 factor, ECF subfamily